MNYSLLRLLTITLLLFTPFFSSCTTAPSEARMPTAQHALYSAGFTNDAVNIYTLPIGAGSCQMVKCPYEDKLIIFDCGSSGYAKMNKDDVVSFVDKLHDGHTEIVVSISHKDDDHTNYLPYLMENISHPETLEKIVIAQVIENYNSETQSWLNENIHKVDIYDANYYSSIEPESSLSCPKDGFASYILTVNSGATHNDKSMVVLSKQGDSQVIFTGDMTGKTEEQIYKNLALLGGSAPFDLSGTDLLFGAHHGASTYGSNNKTWADATSPETVIFSAGEKYSHPTCDAVNVYKTVSTLEGSHRFQCGSSGAYRKINTTKSKFLTHTNGLIVATPDDDGGFEISTFDFSN